MGAEGGGEEGGTYVGRLDRRENCNNITLAQHMLLNCVCESGKGKKEVRWIVGRTTHGEEGIDERRVAVEDVHPRADAPWMGPYEGYLAASIH